MDRTALVQTWIEALEAGDVETLDRLTSDDFVYDLGHGKLVDKESFLETVAALHQAVPELHYNALDLQEQGDRVVASTNPTGVHENPLDLSFMGVEPLEPTGHGLELPTGQADFEVRDGQVSYHGVEGSGLPGLLGLTSGASDEELTFSRVYTFDVDEPAQA